MIVPSIDLMDGETVQLIGGEEKALTAGDPLAIAEHFALTGELAVIDLDAALGQGNNRELIRQLVERHPCCRVGGGVRSVEDAVYWLDAGAQQVIVGTTATPEFFGQLPRERMIAALDARHGEVVVNGWRRKTGCGILERIAELKDYIGGFLVTQVEHEGRLGGMDLEQVAEVVKAAGDARVTVAGGVATAEEIAEIDKLGADAQVGMALYRGVFDLAEGFTAPLRSDRPDGLWPTVVVDELGRALGLAWSNLASVRAAIAARRGVYHSRRRGLWMKGESSGNTQELLRIDLDCDRDAMRFTVRQRGTGFCHRASWTCWGDDWGLGRLARRLSERAREAPENSYTKRLLNEPELLRTKLLEEAGELAAAKTPAEVAQEAADVLYFTFTALARAGVELEQVEQILERRSRRVTRRPGDKKTEDDQ